jgi:hypothetical protein
MGYYMGDYYAGARGDPGIGSFFGGLLSMGASAIPGVGGILGKVTSRLGGLGKVAATGGAMVKGAKGIIMKHPVITAAGAAGTLAVAGAAHHVLAGGRHCRRGTHISKRTGKEVCNRRMNPCNVHALRRAARRAHAFLKISRRLVGHYQARKPKGRAFIKTRGKKK